MKPCNCKLCGETPSASWLGAEYSIMCPAYECPNNGVTVVSANYESVLGAEAAARAKWNKLNEVSTIPHKGEIK